LFISVLVIRTARLLLENLPCGDHLGMGRAWVLLMVPADMLVVFELLADRKLWPPHSMPIYFHCLGKRPAHTLSQKLPQRLVEPK
jgi:hypothetical protein